MKQILVDLDLPVIFLDIVGEDAGAGLGRVARLLEGAVDVLRRWSKVWTRPVAVVAA